MTEQAPTLVMRGNDAGISEAARQIDAGRPVALPTETVYGLAADATCPAAVAAIYDAKGRPAFNPLICHVYDSAMAEQLAHLPAAAKALAQAFWPGPLTLVLPRKADCPVASLATAGLETIALRCPAHPVFRAVLKAVGRPLAAPSANASGRISPTRAEHVLASLGGRIGLILDGGPCQAGLESTILDASVEPMRLLRAGPIGADQLAAVLGYAPALPRNQTMISAPGQLDSHYAPRQPVRLDARHKETGEFLIGFASVPGDANLSPNGDMVEAAAHLFDLLHQAESSGAATIAVAPIPDVGLGQAINDRLRRAAAPRPAKPGQSRAQQGQ